MSDSALSAPQGHKESRELPTHLGFHTRSLCFPDTRRQFSKTPASTAVLGSYGDADGLKADDAGVTENKQETEAEMSVGRQQWENICVGLRKQQLPTCGEKSDVQSDTNSELRTQTGTTSELVCDKKPRTDTCFQ